MDQHKKDLISAYKLQPLTGGVYIVRNTKNDRYLLEAVTNPQGSENKFAFAQKMDNCVFGRLQKDWTTYGKDAFTFTILETIQQKETQTPEEFGEDVKLLGSLWAEKFDPTLSY